MENQILSYAPGYMFINDGNGVSPVKTVEAGYSPSGLIKFDFVYLVGIAETRRSFKIESVGFLREMLEYFLNTTNHGKIHTQRFQFDFYEGERKKRIFFRRDKNLDNIHIKFDRKTRVTMEIEDLKELAEFVASVEKALSKADEAEQQEQKMAKLYIKHYGDIDPVEHEVTAPIAGVADGIKKEIAIGCKGKDDKYFLVLDTEDVKKLVEQLHEAFCEIECGNFARGM